MRHFGFEGMKAPCGSSTLEKIDAAATYVNNHMIRFVLTSGYWPAQSSLEDWAKHKNNLLRGRPVRYLCCDTDHVAPVPRGPPVGQDQPYCQPYWFVSLTVNLTGFFGEW